MKESVSESFKDCVWNKVKTFSSKRCCPHWTRLPSVHRSFLWNEWKYAFATDLQWSIMKRKASVLFGLVAFVPDNRELFGNESNKKKKKRNPYSNTDFCDVWFCWSCRSDHQCISWYNLQGASLIKKRCFRLPSDLKIENNKFMLNLEFFFFWTCIWYFVKWVQKMKRIIWDQPVRH